jgi:hypothetical protein
VDVTGIQFCEVRDQLGRHVALASDEMPHLRDQLRVGDASEGSENIVLQYSPRPESGLGRAA